MFERIALAVRFHGSFFECIVITHLLVGREP